MVALLIAGLASTLVGALPAPVPGASCACCDGGKCLLAEGGCDHRGDDGVRLTSCCIAYTDSPGPAALQAPQDLESAILSGSSASSPAPPSEWRPRSVLLLETPSVSGPEPPPPRSPAAP